MPCSKFSNPNSRDQHTKNMYKRITSSSMHDLLDISVFPNDKDTCKNIYNANELLTILMTTRIHPFEQAGTEF